ncbi:MAG: hypothetical protein K6360_01775 [Deltaproteobacteria bacterium]
MRHDLAEKTRFSRRCFNFPPTDSGESHLPVVVDPSHAAGRRDQVIPLALASAAAGASGLLIEVHSAPDQAVSDGPQSLLPEEFGLLCERLRRMGFVSPAH